MNFNFRLGFSQNEASATFMECELDTSRSLLDFVFVLYTISDP